MVNSFNKYLIIFIVFSGHYTKTNTNQDCNVIYQFGIFLLYNTNVIISFLFIYLKYEKIHYKIFITYITDIYVQRILFSILPL